MSRLPLVLVLGLACAPLPPRGPAPAVQARALPALVLQLDEAAPDVCLEASVRAGSAFDPIGAEGTAGLLARTLADRAATALGPLGGELDADVGREDVTFRVRCPAGRAADCAAVLADTLAVPAFDDADVTRARDAALAGLGARPLDALADDVLDLRVFDAHPYGHDVDGRTGVLGLVDALALRRFHATHYVRAATVIGVGGAASLADAHALEARAGALGDALAADLPLFHALPAEGRELLVVDAPTPVVALRFGRALDPGPDEAAALVLGAEALAVQTGLDVAVVGLDPAPGTHRRRPFLRVRLPDVPAAEAPVALREALARFADAVHGGLAPSAVHEARARLRARLAAASADACTRLAFAVDAVATGRLDALDHLAEAADAVREEQVTAALAAHLDPASLRIVAVGPGGRALADALAAPTPEPSPGVASVAVRPAEGVFR